ncbi:MAG: hypothetical protein WBB67_09820 [bacterium]
MSEPLIELNTIREEKEHLEREFINRLIQLLQTEEYGPTFLYPLSKTHLKGAFLNYLWFFQKLFDVYRKDDNEAQISFSLGDTLISVPMPQQKYSYTSWCSDFHEDEMTFTDRTVTSESGKEVIPLNLEDRAFFEIMCTFSPIEAVAAIYVQRYRDEIHIHVPLTITHYDDDLMNILLQREYNIRKDYPELSLDFYYPPIGETMPSESMHPQAQRIY